MGEAGSVGVHMDALLLPGYRAGTRKPVSTFKTPKRDKHKTQIGEPRHASTSHICFAGLEGRAHDTN